MRQSGSPEMEVASLTKSAVRKWRQYAGCEEVARAAVTDTTIDFTAGARLPPYPLQVYNTRLIDNIFSRILPLANSRGAEANSLGDEISGYMPTSPPYRAIPRTTWVVVSENRFCLAEKGPMAAPTASDCLT